MHLINKQCPHCGSRMVYASREYKWYCEKCARHELQPIEVSHPLLVEMVGRKSYHTVMETRICSNPKCGKEYDAKMGSENTLCPHCINIERIHQRKVLKRKAAA